MTNTLELKDTIENILTKTQLEFDTIHLTAENTEIVFIKIGEYTGMIDTKKYRLNIIGSLNTFDRIHTNIREDDFKTDETIDYTDTRRKVLYLDYNTDLFLIETEEGCKLVYNTL